MYSCGKEYIHMKNITTVHQTQRKKKKMLKTFYQCPLIQNILFCLQSLPLLENQFYNLNVFVEVLFNWVLRWYSETLLFFPALFNSVRKQVLWEKANTSHLGGLAELTSVPTNSLCWSIIILIHFLIHHRLWKAYLWHAIQNQVCILPFLALNVPKVVWQSLVHLTQAQIHPLVYPIPFWKT